MLERLERLVEVLAWDHIVGGVVFIELDTIRYDEVLKEVEDKYSFKETAVKDIGKAIHLNYMGKTFIITYNPKAKVVLEDMYVAFKTKIDDRILDNTGGKTKNDAEGQVVS
jgi:hypothetical protein